MALDAIQKKLLSEVAGLHEIPEGAYNIRLDGETYARRSDEDIEIVPKSDKQGIDIYLIECCTCTRNNHKTILIELRLGGLRRLHR